MLTELILKRWRAAGLVSDKPSAAELEMALEAAIALRMLQDTECAYRLTWRATFILAAVSVAAVICAFIF